MGPVSPGVWKSSGTLADGREIIYFDESPGLGRAGVPDTRPLQPMPGPGGEPDAGLRWDALRGEWVVIAAARQDRTFLPPPGECPLDPSRPGRPTEIPAPDYDVVVFENRFPSLRGGGHWPPGAVPEGSELNSASPQRTRSAAGPPETGGVPQRPAYGRCEVVCFTSDHDGSFAGLSPQRARTVVEAWADRSAELAVLPGVEQVFCFENRGEEIGVTLHHPHGQIYAYPFVTPKTRRMLDGARSYSGRHPGASLFADVLAAERAAGVRVVSANEHWTAFVPAVARWPFEVHVYPNRQVPDIPALNSVERDAFGPVYLDVLSRFDGLFGLPMPYIAAWHQAPVHVGRALAYLHLELFSIRRAPGKLMYLAGSESAMGVFINDVRPEEAARMLREVTP